MPEAVDFAPEWAAAPGLTVARAMQERELSYDELAESLGRSKRFVLDLVSGREAITADVAEALARVVGSTARFWIAREKAYRESLDRLSRTKPELQSWASALPLREMHRLGWIQTPTGSKAIAECLRFFDVSSVERWKQAFESAVVAAAFRSSSAFDTDTGALAAWLRQGEREVGALRCQAWHPDKFEKSLIEIRALTRVKSPALFMPKLQQLCSSAGVAVVVVEAPKGCRASGVARFLSRTRPLIQLSRRHGTDDHFWFTFFHEAGHLLLHPRVDMFIDEIEAPATSREEMEANEFAAGTLLSKEQRERLANLPATYEDVIRFARDVQLSPGIIVGQLQHAKRIPHGWLRKAKRKLDWDEWCN